MSDDPFAVNFPLWVITDLAKNEQEGMLRSIIRIKFPKYGFCMLVYQKEEDAESATKSMNPDTRSVTPFANNMMLAQVLWTFEQEGLSHVALNYDFISNTGRFIEIDKFIRACRDGKA
jgi:hypothetical protein